MPSERILQIQQEAEARQAEQQRAEEEKKRAEQERRTAEQGELARAKAEVETRIAQTEASIQEAENTVGECEQLLNSGNLDERAREELALELKTARNEVVKLKKELQSLLKEKRVAEDNECIVRGEVTQTIREFFSDASSETVNQINTILGCFAEGWMPSEGAFDKRKTKGFSDVQTFLRLIQDEQCTPGNDTKAVQFVDEWCKRATNESNIRLVSSARQEGKRYTGAVSDDEKKSVEETFIKELNVKRLRAKELTEDMVRLDNAQKTIEQQYIAGVREAARQSLRLNNLDGASAQQVFDAVEKALAEHETAFQQRKSDEEQRLNDLFIAAQDRGDALLRELSNIRIPWLIGREKAQQDRKQKQGELEEIKKQKEEIYRQKQQNERSTLPGYIENLKQEVRKAKENIANTQASIADKKAQHARELQDLPKVSLDGNENIRLHGEQIREIIAQKAATVREQRAQAKTKE